MKKRKFKFPANLFVISRVLHAFASPVLGAMPQSSTLVAADFHPWHRLGLRVHLIFGGVWVVKVKSKKNIFDDILLVQGPLLIV